MKHGGLGIPYPQLLVEHAHSASKAASEVLVGSLLGGTNLNFVDNKACIRILIVDAQKQRDSLEIKVITRRKELVDEAGLNCLRQVMDPFYG